MPSEKPTDVTTQLQFGATTLEVDSTFIGYNVPLYGTLTTLVGTSLAAAAATSPRSSRLSSILASSSVANPNVLLAVSTTLPMSGFLLPTTIGITATTTGAGFAGALTPVLPGLSGVPFAADLNELLPLIALTAPGVTGSGVPTTGVSTHAAPDLWISGSVGGGVGLGGLPTLGASLAIGNPNALTQFTTATVNLVNDSANLLTDVTSGAVIAAMVDSKGILSSIAALTKAATGLSLGANGPAPHLPLGTPSVVDLGVDIGGGVSVPSLLFSKYQLTDQIHIGIQADQAGAYALGQVLTQAAPSLNSGLSGGSLPNPLIVLGDLASSLSKLLVDTATSVGSHGTTTATTTPSSIDKPDVIIDIGLNLGESLGYIPLKSQQSLHIDLALNASATLKFGSDLVPIIADIAPLLVKTSVGNELVGAINTSFDQILSQLGLPPTHSSTSAAIATNNTAHPLVAAHIA